MNQATLIMLPSITEGQSGSWLSRDRLARLCRLPQSISNRYCEATQNGGWFGTYLGTTVVSKELTSRPGKY
jgi:hypothetical protein